MITIPIIIKKKKKLSWVAIFHTGTCQWCWDREVASKSSGISTQCEQLTWREFINLPASNLQHSVKRNTRSLQYLRLTPHYADYITIWLTWSTFRGKKTPVKYRDSLKKQEYPDTSSFTVRKLSHPCISRNCTFIPAEFFFCWCCFSHPLTEFKNNATTLPVTKPENKPELQKSWTAWPESASSFSVPRSEICILLSTATILRRHAKLLLFSMTRTFLSGSHFSWLMLAS